MLGNDAVSEGQTVNTRDPNWVPGEAGIWLFILGDMVAFSVLLTAYALDATASPSLFAEARSQLNIHYGAINTLILLFSSGFVARAVDAIRAGRHQAAKQHLIYALLLAIAFVALKIFEYNEKLGAGNTAFSNDFFMYYYLITGIHLLHLIVGTGVIAWMISRCREVEGRATSVGVFEGGGAYWHMVDLLWVVIFPLLYLLN